MPKVIDVLSKGPLQIKYVPGRSKTIVVSFAGVGTKRSVCPPPEFFNVAGMQGADHVLFISDMSRSWLNMSKMAAQIRFVIEWFREKIGATRVVAIGNSMGGTMALLMSDLVKFETVTALFPQVSADPLIVPEERRWMYFRKRIEEFRFQQINQLVAPDTKYFAVHGGTENDLVHARRFPVIKNGAHYILPKFDHNLAGTLRKSNHLQGLMFHMMSGHKKCVQRRMTRLGALSISDYAAFRLQRAS